MKVTFGTWVIQKTLGFVWNMAFTEEGEYLWNVGFVWNLNGPENAGFVWNMGSSDSAGFVWNSGWCRKFRVLLGI